MNIRIRKGPLVPKYQTDLDAKIAKIINGDPRIASHAVDCYIDRAIAVDLAVGFNYEGREGFVAFGLKEFKSMIAGIQPNE
jgi:hypothetical protein